MIMMNGRSNSDSAKHLRPITTEGVSRTRRRIALGLVASRKFRRTGDMLGTAPGGEYQPGTSDREDIRLTDHRAREGLSVSRNNNLESRKQQAVGIYQIHQTRVREDV